VLLGLLEQTQKTINRISPLFWLFDWMFRKKDEQFAGFSLMAAREYAWACAVRLHERPEYETQAIITETDVFAEMIGRKISSPPRFLQRMVSFISRFEWKGVRARMEWIEHSETVSQVLIP
jgi:hypothetical protein